MVILAVEWVRSAGSAAAKSEGTQRRAGSIRAMHLAWSYALAGLVVSTAASAQSPDGGSPVSVAQAMKRLDAAREQLKAAVARIQVDPPATADLDAAHAAVGALKDAIDFGAQNEAADLDYARAALAARKELRTQREYVDQRRANVHIHEHRRTIDAALPALAERFKQAEAKGAAPKDIEDARASVAAVKKLLKEARPFAKDDPTFASYLAQTEESVSQKEKALDDRWTLLAVDKHRAVLEERRQGLSKSMAGLTTAATDAQFEEADRAAASLSKLIDEGAAFEPRDKTYRGVAEKARAELTQAKKKLEELISGSGLARLTSQIDPARQDLANAAKALRAKKPTEEQLAEAKTAAFVVRKLVEKFQPQAARSEAFGKYVADVTAKLMEVEVNLQQRALDSARGEIAQAVKNLERRDATDDQFAELNTAITVMEKTMEDVHKKEPTIAARLYDAKKQIAEARATLSRRRIEVDVERQRRKVKEAMQLAEAAVKELQQPSLAAESFPPADEAVKGVRALLEEGAPLIKLYGDYKQFDKEQKERLAILADRIASRKIFLAASNGKARLNETTAEGRAKLDAAKRPESTDADVAAAAKAVKALTEAIEANAAVEKQDASYAANAEKARGELQRQTEALELATATRTLRRETGEALAAGVAAVKEAEGLAELRRKDELYKKALGLFGSCVRDGPEQLSQNPVLAKAVVLVDGNPSNADDAIRLCGEQSKAVEQTRVHVQALLAYEDGPKKGFESGKALLAQGKSAEALKQFEECISSGAYAQYKYPELKQGKYSVAGSSMTVAELVEQCVGQRKALVKK